MKNLTLEFPSLKREKQGFEFIQEFRNHHSPINGTGALDRYDDYPEWIQRTIDHSKGLNLGDNRVKATTFFAIVDDEIVGMVNIRHQLNDYLITHGYGHIGYGVRPTKRRLGYATEILRLAIIFLRNEGVKDIHVSCYKDNIGSKKTILNNGGKVYKEFTEENGRENIEFIISE